LAPRVQAAHRPYNWAGPRTPGDGAAACAIIVCVARVTFDLRGPGSLDDADARTVAGWLEAELVVAGALTLAAKIRAALDWEPKGRRAIPLNATERSALLGVLTKALDSGDLNGDRRSLQQSLLA
jgi:hypothetical protein